MTAKLQALWLEIFGPTFRQFLAEFDPRDPLKGPRGPLKGPRGPLKGPRGPLKGPRDPLKGPWGPFKGTRDPLKGPRQGTLTDTEVQEKPRKVMRCRCLRKKRDPGVLLKDPGVGPLKGHPRKFRRHPRNGLRIGLRG